MKIWVCRDNCGDREYKLYKESCSPCITWNGEIWYCECGEHDHLLRTFCGDIFKKYTGIKRHMRPGTKKLMDWTLPLARQGRGKS